MGNSCRTRQLRNSQVLSVHITGTSGRLEPETKNPHNLRGSEGLSEPVSTSDKGPSFGFEPKTYALRKRLPESVTPLVSGACSGCDSLVAPMVALQSPENACERVRTCDQTSDARNSLPADLARVVAAWPMLPPDVKAKISALVSQAEEDCRRSCKMAAQEAGNHQGSSPL